MIFFFKLIFHEWNFTKEKLIFLCHLFNLGMQRFALPMLFICLFENKFHSFNLILQIYLCISFQMIVCSQIFIHSFQVFNFLVKFINFQNILCGLLWRRWLSKTFVSGKGGDLCFGQRFDRVGKWNSWRNRSDYEGKEITVKTVGEWKLHGLVLVACEQNWVKRFAYKVNLRKLLTNFILSHNLLTAFLLKAYFSIS